MMVTVSDGARACGGSVTGAYPPNNDSSNTTGNASPRCVFSSLAIASFSAMTTRGSASLIMPASSLAAWRAYSGTAMAPSPKIARSVATQRVELPATSTTRSPGSTPCDFNAPRATDTRRFSSAPKVGSRVA